MASTLFTVRVVEQVRSTFVAFLANEVGVAFAFTSVRVTGLTDRTGHVTVAFKALRVLVKAGSTLIAFSAAEASLADAFTVRFRAGLGLRAVHVTITRFTLRSKKARRTFVTLLSSEIRLAEANAAIVLGANLFRSSLLITGA